MLRNVEIRGVHAAGNGPSSDRKCWQRLELGIHGLNRWTVNCLENAEFKQTKRPERGQKCWQRLERNRSPSPTLAGGPVAKPEITRSGRGHPLSGTEETWLAAFAFRALNRSLALEHFARSLSENSSPKSTSHCQ